MQLKPSRPKRAPPHLASAGAKLWRELVNDYAVRDPAGLALATCAGECLDRMRAAQESIAGQGAIVMDRYGAPKLNPACGLEKDARNGLIAALKALNLGPLTLKSAPNLPTKGKRP